MTVYENALMLRALDYIFSRSIKRFFSCLKLYTILQCHHFGDIEVKSTPGISFSVQLKLRLADIMIVESWSHVTVLLLAKNY